MSQESRRRTAVRRVPPALALLALLAAGLSACDVRGGNPLAASPYDATGQITSSAADGSHRVDPNKPLEVNVKGDGARITDVITTDATGRFLAGELSADGRAWRSSSALAAGAHYTVRVSTENGDGRPGRRTLGFDTVPAGNSLSIRFGPDAGTYGVGQPITAELSKPVTGTAARAVIERGLHVNSAPAVTGAWHWVDNRTLHYRPREYWPTGTRIQVTSTLNGTKIQDGVYGGAAAPLALSTGDQVIAVTDAAAHTLTLRRNGHVERTVPVTTGKPGFETRNGIKVVIGKESFVRMKSSTIGIGSGTRDSYDLPVYWATRVTWSGEYVHAAPWSVGSQGSANVSHGCTGMSTDNAHWFFGAVRLGDIVQVVGSRGQSMEPFGNGFGDWNLSWDQWLDGSAAHGQGGASGDAGHGVSHTPPDTTARLTPQI
jgi:lipoprotein-anchoring transpeptidase ErfK/SrfK